MADDTTADTTTADDTTQTPDPPDDKSSEDVSGLKSALETERAQRKEFEKELKALRVAEDQRKQEAMSETEKAIAQAKAEGHAEAMKAAGTKLAAAELKAAAKDKGVNLADLLKADLIKVDAFVDENGDVNTKAIEKAVAAFADVAPAQAPGRSGAQIPGGSGGRTASNPTLDSAVAAHYGT